MRHPWLVPGNFIHCPERPAQKGLYPAGRHLSVDVSHLRSRLSSYAFFRLLGRLHWAVRGSIYAALIFAAEYVSGSLLWKKDLCPWDYEKARWNVSRLIRLDYFPCWAATGLLMERATRDAGRVPRH